MGGVENKPAWSLCGGGDQGTEGGSKMRGDLELREWRAKCCVPDLHQEVTQNLHHRYFRGGCFSEGGSQESQCSSASNEYQRKRPDGVL